ncbi:unnamed protein product [Euphydryas editha]|uniref:Uncharacterized protein n=1 Tax=Euphydryas editha TaxID=104508 RepID=A0AAU9UG22_EUPED|nr:unnamed protein product [Euphydryas editha]
MKIVIVISLMTFIFACQTKLITAEKDERHVDNWKEKVIREYLNVYNTKVRKPREPEKKAMKCDNRTEAQPTVKPKVALVKKPIPKFTDTDSSEEDYQMKMTNPIKQSDSIEHEDEDFNIDDYDFDVQHDEFAGRGKPLEPRTKVKIGTRRTEHHPVKTNLEISKTPLSPKKIVPRRVNNPLGDTGRKTFHVIKEDDYDDEFSTSTKPPGKGRKSAMFEDDISNESEDSKEYEGRASVRTVRSPITFRNYIDKFGEKTSALMTKLLTYLPIFPQIHALKT